MNKKKWAGIEKNAKTLKKNVKNLAAASEYLKNLPEEGYMLDNISKNVVEIGHYHENEQEGYAYILCSYHEFLAGLAPCYHLVEQEEHVATVECRYGKDVHEGQDDAQKGRHAPEFIPVPLCREQSSDGTEASERLHSL